MTERKCKDCESELFLSMVSLSSGIWMCTSKLCNFPLNSSELENYMEKLNPIETENDQRSKQLFISETAQWNKPRKTRTLKSSSTSSTSSNEGRRSRSSNYNPNYDLYPLWKDQKPNHYWLNVTLTLLVTNHLIRQKLADSESPKLRQFISEYLKCQELYAMKHDYDAIKDTLLKIRNDIKSILQPEMPLSSGQLDSPQISLQSLFKMDAKLYEMTACQYTYNFHCGQCGTRRQNQTKTCLLTIPNCVEDFSVPNKLGFVKDCLKCKSKDQINSISFDKPSDFIFIHCTGGFEKSKFWQDYFPRKKKNGGSGYFISHIVQYTNNRYILWSFDVKKERWLKADDRENHACSFTYEEPDLTEQESKIVVWQNISKLLRDKDSDDIILEALALKTSSVSSSSSSSSLDNATKCSSMIHTRPRMMKNWLKKVDTKPLIFETNDDFDSKQIEKQNEALGRYKPYVSRRNRKPMDCSDKNNSSVGDNVGDEGPSIEKDTLSIDSNISNQENYIPSHHDDYNDTQCSDKRNQLIKNDIRTDYDKKETLFDSAYSSPISDANEVRTHGTTVNRNSNLSTNVTSSNAFDVAMAMVDDLFEEKTHDDLDFLSFSGLSSQDNSFNYFGTEIDINKLF